MYKVANSPKAWACHSTREKLIRQKSPGLGGPCRAWPSAVQPLSRKRREFLDMDTHTEGERRSIVEAWLMRPVGGARAVVLRSSDSTGSRISTVHLHGATPPPLGQHGGRAQVKQAA